MNGQLFTQDFLLRGIHTTPVWAGLPERELSIFSEALHAVYAPYSLGSVINEAITEDEIVLKVLALLGWGELILAQVTASSTRREDVPDLLLFADSAAKQRALREKREDRRYRHGLAIVESKRWQRPLDRGDASDTLNPGTPSNQILRYLSTIEVASERAISWGILTNGRVWRLYYQGARSRSEEFLEVDVALLLNLPGIQGDIFSTDAAHDLKLFLLMFRREAFLPQSWDTDRRTFHLYAIAEARLYEAQVSQDLGSRVFTQLFPNLADALAKHDPQAPAILSRAYLDTLRDAALILLYRLLFVLYAEDRNLLPVRDPRYYAYSLRKLREDIRDRRDSGAQFSGSSLHIWGTLDNLFRAIALGDAALGLPAYNGGLFDDSRTPLFARVRLPDALLAPIIDELSRRGDDLIRAWINYRDLSVQQLGSIYERLLDYRLETEQGRVVPRPTSFARRVSGSYYTHDDLVKLLIRETIAPLLDEKAAAFAAFIKRSKKRRELQPAHWTELDNCDPASHMLALRICDPAMGSGHFLVSLVDYFADQVLEAMSQAAEDVSEQSWAKHTPQAWASPLATRIQDIRQRLLQAALEQGWTVDREQLDDRHIVRRMILKRVIHGVDKNPMAVELAKLALWLHTFTVGAPLSFLDHHLRVGDALHGEQLAGIRSSLIGFGVLFQEAELNQLALASLHMSEIADLTDVDIAEAHRSKNLLAQIETELAPLNALQHFWRGLRWLIPGWPAVRRLQHTGLAELLSGRYNLSGTVAAGSIEPADHPAILEANALLSDTRALAAREHFLHWPTAFPGVWADPDPARRGFDAIIGNPPWDKIKLQEVEWFAERKPAIAHAVRASDRKRLIGDLKKHEDPLWLDYVEARNVSETAARVFRECGDYPLLSGGDINLYALFVERAAELIHARGVVGLLTPSGIAADLGAAPFFRSLTESQLHTLPHPNPLPEGEGTKPFSGSGKRQDAACSSPSIEDATILLLPPGEGRDEGVIVAADHTEAQTPAARLIALLDFENKKVFFPDIDSRFKFCALVFGGVQRRVPQTRCAFYLHALAELEEPGKVLTLSAQDFAAVNPNTGAAPIFRSPRDAEITLAIYRRQPVLVNRCSGVAKKLWPLRYLTMFHMTNDAALFKRRDELENEGWYPVAANRWKKGEAEAVPLYEGKMVQMYDHRAADVVVNTGNLHRPAQQVALDNAEHENPNRYPHPQFSVERPNVDAVFEGEWALAFKSITAPTNVRTMIAALLPKCGVGNSMAMLVDAKNAAINAQSEPETSIASGQRKTIQTEIKIDTSYSAFAPLLLANLNSFALDYCLRQKVQGQNLNWYIVEQLPLIRPEQFERSIGKVNIADFIRGEVLRLTYTAHDLAAFARDQGYDGQPFVWNEDERRHRLARLDALFFHLYELNREDAAYILEQFPIVREHDQRDFGRYLTRDLILAYMNAVTAGDFETRVEIM